MTGAPGVGKSTLVERAAALIGGRAGGVSAREVRIGGRRIGFQLSDLLTGEVGTLASLDGPGPKVGRYRVHLADLEEVGARAIERAVREAELVVIDEVGPMELLSEEFVEAVEAALDSDKPILAVVHMRSEHPLAKKIREGFRLFVVTPESRDRLAGEVAAETRP